MFEKIKPHFQHLINLFTLSLVGVCLGTYLSNYPLPYLIDAADNLRDGLGVLGILLILTPFIDRIVTPNNMWFSISLCSGIGGILISWYLGINISL